MRILNAALRGLKRRRARSRYRVRQFRQRWRAFWRRVGHRGRHVGHGWRILGTLPVSVRLVILGLILVALLTVANLVYQVIRKPSEMFFPVSGALYKTPTATWYQYGPLFQEYSTASITPELLAALAQVEGSGNPIARTYWRWHFTFNPFDIYRPASTSVGLYQMTDPAFDEARHYCIHDHAVIEEGGAWDDWQGCWFNWFYTRIIPSHAIELATIYLDRAVTGILARDHISAATTPQKEELAAMVHLCGAGPASEFARRGFRLRPGKHCGDQDAATYLLHVDEMKRQFLHLAAEPAE